ncbi:peptide/nickel transport system substrate-binding protein [Peribacillus deserti]|uniref:Peptide/nickel transport system substrate-binding protein n=1 Tax=Peribacillus deserti TaxID=673318 RepID=A0ABS2QJ26_9BACI|nr:ABC transporter substrate-binding protein [Peribacillus deserti]MBM7693129.1 peptide/nickel transport system substrate-binding protein [Peribacillus deserti]
MNRSLTKWLTLLLILTFALAGCSSNSSSGGSAKGVSAQEVTYATTSKVVGLSPILTNDSVSSSVTEQIYETLFYRDSKTNEIKGLLAEKAENPDPNTWVITLKKGIEFQDGTEFNAEAVKYTFDKIKDPKTAAPRASLLEPIQSIEVKDPQTVILKTEKPYGPMLAALTHSNAAIVSPAADKKQDLMKDPVGTGPFKFKAKENGEDIVLEANKDYWQEAPKLKKVTFKVVPEITTAVSMLQTGKVNFLDNVTAELLPRVEKLNNVNIEKKAGTPVYYLAFNMEKEPMNNPEFRKAVAYALDTEGYVKKLRGLGVKSSSFIGPELFGYDKSSEDKAIKFDSAKAKEIVKANGFDKQQITLLAANTAGYMNMAEVFQAQLSEAGMKVKIETLEWGTYLEASQNGKFDLTVAGWSNVTGDGSELLFPRLHSKNAGATNVGRYKNPELDKLIEQSRSTVDQNERKQYLKQANELVLSDLPVIPIYHGVASIAADNSVNGINLEPTGQWSLYKAERK